jgi:hypothetical protein
LHAAVAGDGDFAGGVGSGDEFPAGAFAVGAILERHADSIRLREWNGKVRVVGKMWKVRDECLQIILILTFSSLLIFATDLVFAEAEDEIYLDEPEEKPSTA